MFQKEVAIQGYRWTKKFRNNKDVIIKRKQISSIKEEFYEGEKDDFEGQFLEVSTQN